MNCALFAKMDQIFSLKKQNIKKILEKWQKILENQGILSVWKSGNPVDMMCVCVEPLG